MNLILRPHENYGDPVWSVIILLIILLIGVSYYIYTLMVYAFKELEDGSNDTTKQEELLQLQSGGDQQSSGRGHDRRDDRSGVRPLQEGESESGGSGHSGKENKKP